MKISPELKEALREHHERLDEDSYYWSTPTTKRNQIKDILFRKRKNKCICKYKNASRNNYASKTGWKQAFHIHKQHELGIDLAVFKADQYLCKQCGKKIHVATKKQRKNTEFIKYKKLPTKKQKIPETRDTNHH